MTFGDWTVVAWMLIIAAVCGFAFVWGRLRYMDGWDDRGCHERERDLRLAELRRERGPEPVIRAKTGPLPVPGWADTAPIRHRSAVTATDIAPVTVPPPKLTDTGELRAIREQGEAIRAAMVTGELAFRHKAGWS